MNIAFMQDSLINQKKSNGRQGMMLKNIIFSNAPEFRGYEYYINQNKTWENENSPYRYKMIPCGKCIGCRTEERKNWAFRIEQEAKQYKHNYFITLTYNDENLPVNDEITITLKDGTEKTYTNDGTWGGTLRKNDMVQFIKSLRTYFEREYEHKGLKFYGCGEYGNNGTERPHLHIILMNCPNLDKDLVRIGYNPKTKDNYYTHERIENIWHKGFINIGKVTWDSIAYTAGYSTKKRFGDIGKEIMAEKGQEPIFANMSRRPGIGKAFWEKYKWDIYETDEVFNSKGQTIKIPRYFDKLMDIGNDDEYYLYKHMKTKREWKAEWELDKKLSQTTRPYKEQLLIEEEKAKDKQKAYKRGRIKT